MPPSDPEGTRLRLKQVVIKNYFGSYISAITGHVKHPDAADVAGSFDACGAGYWLVMTTAGLVVLGVVAIGALALIIVFIWLLDARRNEHVAHDLERIEQPPGAEPDADRARQHSPERRDPRG